MDFRARILTLLLVCFSLAFASIVISISLTDPLMLNLPLSEFRFGRWAALGIAAFFLLIGIGVIYISAAFLYADNNIQFVSLVSALLMIFVSVTPTFHVGHELAANGLMLFLYGSFLIRLYLVSSVWLFVHIFAPIAILAGLLNAGVFGFGTVQKSMILYLVLVVFIDCLILMNVPVIPEWSFLFRKAKSKSARIPVPKLKKRPSPWEQHLEPSST